MLDIMTLEGDIYSTYSIHSVTNSDSLSIDYDYYKGGGEYFLSEGIVFYVENDIYKRLDPIISSRILEASLTKEPKETREITMAYSQEQKSSYILNNLEPCEISSTEQDMLFSKKVFDGSLFEIREIYNYNYDEDLGSIDDSYQINVIPTPSSSGIPFSPSVIKKSKLKDIARSGNLYEAIEIESVGRKVK